VICCDARVRYLVAQFSRSPDETQRDKELAQVTWRIIDMAAPFFSQAFAKMLGGPTYREGNDPVDNRRYPSLELVGQQPGTASDKQGQDSGGSRPN
jgi:hypothetical protein